MLHAAHTLPPPAHERDWEPLRAHLGRVARRAGRYGEAFDSRAWGRVAGLWHDLGKYRPEFQEYLRGRHPGVPHAGAGAALAATRRADGATALAFAVAGHHAGLANLRSNESAVPLGDRAQGLPTPLRDRLVEAAPVAASLRPIAPPRLYGRGLPPLPGFLAAIDRRADPAGFARSAEFWTRMLFSALVDADRLATAAFHHAHDPPDVAEADLVYDDVPTLRRRLDAHVDALAAGHKEGASAVNALRAGVLAACRRRAADPPGRFALTVPTGGGKTLAAMSFALRHAERHGLRRVIVVIPYTSIIEQNAAAYRAALDDPATRGVKNVLEHHGNLDEQKLTELDAPAEARRKLAAENWDAPVVVTTSVQFFESLFSNHPSRCRKLHRIARSVVVLDEVQTLPPEVLAPTLDALRELTDHYGCTAVLSTATPPALARRDDYEIGLTGVREIVDEPRRLAASAKRVKITWPEPGVATPYADLARTLAGREKVLAVVHRRRDARLLAELVAAKVGGAKAGGLFHLSALMCPAHRLAVLARVRDALAGDGPCRLVATQLVEAGVDLDFPAVYRALAGLDSLAQAAGRCDREGRLTAAAGTPAGEFVVFRAETSPPPGTLRKALESTESLLRLRGPAGLDPFDPADCEAFFREFYGKTDPDAFAVQLHRRNHDFATTAAAYRLIDDATAPVVVPHADAADRVEAFRKSPTRAAQRALQPYLVQVNAFKLNALRAAGVTERVHDRVDVLADAFRGRYHGVWGLDPDLDVVADPEALMA